MNLEKVVRTIIFWVIAAVWGFVAYTMLSFVGFHWEHHNISILAWPFAGFILFNLGLGLYWPLFNWDKIVGFFKKD